MIIKDPNKTKLQLIINKLQSSGMEEEIPSLKQRFPHFFPDGYYTDNYQKRQQDDFMERNPQLIDSLISDFNDANSKTVYRGSDDVRRIQNWLNTRGTLSVDRQGTYKPKDPHLGGFDMPIIQTIMEGLINMFQPQEEAGPAMLPEKY